VQHPVVPRRNQHGQRAAADAHRTIDRTQVGGEQTDATLCLVHRGDAAFTEGGKIGGIGACDVADYDVFANGSTPVLAPIIFTKDYICGSAKCRLPPRQGAMRSSAAVIDGHQRARSRSATVQSTRFAQCDVELRDLVPQRG
jgi:hypothetical protein